MLVVPLVILQSDKMGNVAAIGGNDRQMYENNRLRWACSILCKMVYFGGGCAFKLFKYYSKGIILKI